MASFNIVYNPDPPPTNLPQSAREYLSKELDKIARALKLADGVAKNHEGRIQTLEGP